MYARVTNLAGPPENFDRGARYIEEQVVPRLRQMDGFRGFVALGDRQGGRLLGVAFWEDEDALQATETPVSAVRSAAAEAVGGEVTGVDVYEVAVFEV